jgi:hypothetical protein
MVLHTNAPPPLLLLIGAAFLAGAALLAWLSAMATLHLTRTNQAGTVQVQFEERLFGLIRIGGERIDGVRAVSVVSGRLRESKSTSHTPDRLIFNTAAGAVDLGYVQQRFLHDASDIREFFAQQTERALSISSARRFDEALRFAAAQLGVAVLAAFGVLLIYLGVRAIFPDPNKGIGPV